jgi:hypothetical protein
MSSQDQQKQPECEGGGPKKAFLDGRKNPFEAGTDVSLVEINVQIRNSNFMDVTNARRLASLFKGKKPFSVQFFGAHINKSGGGESQDLSPRYLPLAGETKSGDVPQLWGTSPSIFTGFYLISKR